MYDSDHQKKVALHFCEFLKKYIFIFYDWEKYAIKEGGTSTTLQQ